MECREWNRAYNLTYRQRRRSEGRPVASGGSRRFIKDSERLAIYERDDWVCQLCLEAIDRTASPNSSWAPSLDHIVPQSAVEAPDHSPRNLRTAHRWCNSIRGDGSTYDDGYFLVAS